jgi:Flp pilus assembly protein TadG
MRNRLMKNQRGAALLETAITLPLILLVCVAIFEFGRAYQTWQVLTNAAREGARMAVLPNQTQSAVEQRVRNYMQAGQLPRYSTASVTVNSSATITVNGAPVQASQVTVDYPFNFIVLQPVARLVTPSTSLGSAITMRAEAVMRNEPN